ncbi:MAG: VanZ family protein [Candidatus Buchananbacteria bacterium]
MSKKVINWLAVIAWLAVIFYFSNQPNLKSEFEPLWDLIFRKIAHMAEFFVLAYLFFNALSKNKVSLKKKLFLVLILTFLSAVFDEYHQSFIANRVASPVDVGIDSLGILGFVMLKLIEKRN